MEVDSIESCLKRAEELGGAVVLPRTAISTIGYMAHLTDPDGGIVGLFEAKKRG